jgi:peptidoglycan/xylan/chitin deacetylase (PgdA/CDA1 family)
MGSEEGAGVPSFNQVITIDVHNGDDPRAIDHCSGWLEERGLPATFFVPTALLRDDRLGPVLRRLGSSIHAIGTHGHLHNKAEMGALRGRDRSALGFLEHSRDLHEAIYGQAPELFRAPRWCAMSGVAFAALDELGYRVDCSSTPQRPGILSSDPLRSPWLRAPREPYFVSGRLLEVPTSCFLLPLASPTFHMLRRRASMAFVRLLALEAKFRSRIVLNLMLHPEDFFPESSRHRRPRRLTVPDLVPRQNGGLMWRHALKTRDPERIVDCTHGLLATTPFHGVTTLREIYARCHRANERRTGRTAESAAVTVLAAGGLQLLAGDPCWEVLTTST